MVNDRSKLRCPNPDCTKQFTASAKVPRHFVKPPNSAFVGPAVPARRVCSASGGSFVRPARGAGPGRVPAKRTRIEDPAGTPALQDAIRHLHGVESTWVESVPVKDTFAGEVAWEGVVQVFALRDHPSASKAYVWSHATTGTKRRFVAVLGGGPIDSPEMAVKAAIVQEGRERLGVMPN